jgi:hypothetical protein
MKTATLAALLLSTATAFAALPAFASDDAAKAQTQSQASNNAPKTRAEVKAELAQAKADGELSLNPNAPDYPQQYAMGGYTAPRAQVSSGFFHTAHTSVN